MADKSVTDKANEQGWGSTVNAAANQVKQATDSVAESIRGTVGDQIADGLKTGGEYTKAGIQNTGEAIGLKGSKPTHDQAHEDLNNLTKDAKNAGKNIKADLEQGMQDINAKTRTNADTNFDKAAAKGQAAYDSAAAKGAEVSQKAADKLDAGRTSHA